MFGGNFFVIVNDGVTFIPITDLAGKSEEDIEALVVERVTADVMTRLVEVSGDAAAPAVAASDEEISAALASIQAADVAGVAAKEAAEATREAWGYISPEDLEEATQQAAQVAAQEAAAIASHMAVENALQALIDSGASEAEIDAFIEANPAPSE